MKPKDKETPLMKQYNLFKKKYPGALLLFRVGDFYETFGEDAIKTSKILNIVLTKRANGVLTDLELAGFPYHSLDTYLPKLVRAGERVAICDQLEDAKFAKGIVKRGVTELVTPGVVLNDNVLEVKRNNYLAAVFEGKNKDNNQKNKHNSQNGNFGIAFLDISTGEFICTQGNFEYIDKLLQSFSPSEILVPKPRKAEFKEKFGENYNVFYLDDWAFGYDFSENKLKEHFKVQSLKGFGIDAYPEGVVAAGAILQYLADTEHLELSHIAYLGRLEEDKYVWLDRFTIRNLELLFPQQENGVPLIQVLDRTRTSMGGRLLRKWVVLPLKEKDKIEERLNLVESLVKNTEILEKLEETLAPIGDLERIISKVAAKRINPKEMLALKRSLLQIPKIKEILVSLQNIDKQNEQNTQNTNHSIIKTLQKFFDALNPCQELCEKIENELREDALTVTNLGKLIKPNIDANLDELHGLMTSGKEALDKILIREIARTNINSLKIQYNKVFGYFIEVSNANKDKVPTDWTRKQTLTNAERYITQELKEYEEKILSADEKSCILEQKLFFELVNFAQPFVLQVQKNAQIVATIDVLTSFANISLKNNYVRPVISENNILNIKDGRHPVIEQQLTLGEQYIPNDTFLDTEKQQIIVITGPNMAGKSALLRQVALITLMTQMGSFVPASYAEIGLVDKVFTRVGASDNVSKGESTFMVEMTETASIMNNLSDKSLVLMDEIGRGTSTYDGISIAWSLIEYLHNHPKFRPKTLFATHYHELNELEKELPRVKNYNVSVKELENKVIFLRKLKVGGSEHSFGIHVAQMAGMPPNIIARANEVLLVLEKEKIHEENTQKLQELPRPATNSFGQVQIFDAYNPELEKIKSFLMKIDTNTLTPIEAMMKLIELQKVVQ
jgi:DNA mismatch repair protein MutS